MAAGLVLAAALAWDLSEARCEWSAVYVVSGLVFALYTSGSLVAVGRNSVSAEVGLAMYGVTFPVWGAVVGFFGFGACIYTAALLGWATRSWAVACSSILGFALAIGAAMSVSAPSGGDAALPVMVAAWNVVVGSTVVWWAWTWKPSEADRTVCAKCGYDLRGNVTGVCPECGKATRRDEP